MVNMDFPGDLDFNNRLAWNEGGKNVRTSLSKISSIITSKVSKILGIAVTALSLSANPVQAQDGNSHSSTIHSDSSNVPGIDTEMMLYDLDSSSFDYYMAYLLNDDVREGVLNIQQSILEKTGIHMVGVDLTVILDLHIAKHSGDPFLWKEAYDYIQRFYPAYAPQLQIILTELGYNPYGEEC